MRLWQILGRSFRLRCPACGRGKLFAGWFTMRPECEHCGLRFEREPGFFLGSIYVNYGLTAVLVTAAYFGLFFTNTLTDPQRPWSLVAFSVLFPLWFFRYARSLWLGFDQLFDPRARQTPATPGAGRDSSVAPREQSRT
ncbi:MAG: DUF983 domain-containing protein [Pirellulales bacterium]